MIVRTLLVGLALALAATAADAEQCQLKQIASLDIVVGNDGVMVPMTVEGRAGGYFVLDFGGLVSGLADSTATDLHLKRDFVPSNVMLNIFDHKIREQVTASIQFGATKGDVFLAVIPQYAPTDPRIIGVLAMDILRNLDVELDIGRSKLNLFSPDHCRGQVVYWTRTSRWRPSG